MLLPEEVVLATRAACMEAERGGKVRRGPDITLLLWGMFLMSQRDAG